MLVAVVLATTLFMPAGPASAAPATILGSWTDANSQTVFVRQGTYNAADQNGFGMAKITQKHGILAVSNVKFVTQNPNGGVAQGNDRLYTAYANKIVCNPTCRVAESIQVRAVMGNGYQSVYYGIRIKGAVGIKTTYCLTGATLCPSWVNAALARSAPSSDGSTTSVAWSYEGAKIGSVVPAPATLLSPPVS